MSKSFSCLYPKICFYRVNRYISGAAPIIEGMYMDYMDFVRLLMLNRILSEVNLRMMSQCLFRNHYFRIIAFGALKWR